MKKLIDVFFPTFFIKFLLFLDFFYIILNNDVIKEIILALIISIVLTDREIKSMQENQDKEE